MGEGRGKGEGGRGKGEGGRGKAKRVKKKPPVLEEQGQKPSGATQTIISR